MYLNRVLRENQRSKVLIVHRELTNDIVIIIQSNQQLVVAVHEPNCLQGSDTRNLVGGQRHGYVGQHSRTLSLMDAAI